MNNIEQMLPEGYNYIILEPELYSDEEFSVIIRINIVTKEEVLLWINKFQTQNLVTFTVDKTYEEDTDQRVFKKRFKCLHNTRPRKGSISHPKHTGCRARLTVTVKKYMKRSKDPYISTHPSSIALFHVHNHPLDTESALKFRPPLLEVQNKIKFLLQKGHSPDSALTTCKNELLDIVDSNIQYHEIVADHRQCPRLHWINQFYENVFHKEYEEPDELGLYENMVKSVREYNNSVKQTNCAAITKQDDNIIVAICTPIMKRIHENVESCRQIILIDSAELLHRPNIKVVTFVCPCLVGALPLGILLIHSENVELGVVTFENAITCGIKLLKSVFPEQSFYGHHYPEVILTNDYCPQIIDILQKSFRNSTLFFSKYHILQSTMRHIWDPQNSLSKVEKTHIYCMFHDSINTVEVDEFLKKFDDLLAMDLIRKSDSVNEYFNKLRTSAPLWATCCKPNIFSEGNESDTYFLPMFHFLREQILDITRDFNLIQIFDIVITNFHFRYFNSISSIINGQVTKPKRKKKYFQLNPFDFDVVQLDDVGCNLYEIHINRNEFVVNNELECCTCYISRQKRLLKTCRHELAVIVKTSLPSYQFNLDIDDDLKQLLYFVINGKELETDDYTDETDNYSNDEEAGEIIKIVTTNAELEMSNDDDEAMKIDDDDDEPINKMVNIEEEFDIILDTIKKKYKNHKEEYKDAILEFINQFHACSQNDTSLISALQNFGKSTFFEVPTDDDDDVDEEEVQNVNNYIPMEIKKPIAYYEVESFNQENVYENQSPFKKLKLTDNNN